MGRVRSFPPGVPVWIDYGTEPGTVSAARFYCGLFGWRVLARHRPIDDRDGYWVFQKEGRDVGGVGPDQHRAWTVHMGVTDIEATAEAILDNGGRLVLPPFPVYDAGWLGLGLDPSGARFGFWQAKEHTGVDTEDEPNAFAFAELACRDVETARSFYQAVFGWEAAIEPYFAPGSTYTRFSLPDVAGTVTGMVEMNEQWPVSTLAHWMVYFAVTDTDAMAARAAELGGSVPVPPFDLEGRGRIAVINDSEGGVFSVVHPA